MGDSIAKSDFRTPYQANGLFFFRRTPRQRPQKSVRKGLWNRLEHRHELNVNGFCGVHLDANVFWGFATKMGSEKLQIGFTLTPKLPPNQCQNDQVRSLQASPDTIE